MSRSRWDTPGFSPAHQGDSRSPVAQCIQRGLHQLQETVAEQCPGGPRDKGQTLQRRTRQALKHRSKSQRGSLLLAQALVLGRLAGDSPEALLANQYERLPIYRAFRQAVGEHG